MTGISEQEKTEHRAAQRLVIYAVSRAVGRIDDYVDHAISAIRPFAARLVIVVPDETPASEIARMRTLGDDVMVSRDAGFDPTVYYWAVRRQADLPSYDEVVLTGDSWFGPVKDLGAVLQRIASDPAPVKAMVENAGAAPEEFPEAGFVRQALPWTWTAVRSDIVASARWSEFWGKAHRRDWSSADLESEFLTYARLGGMTISIAFPSAHYPSANPVLFTPSLLLDDGFPFLSRLMFGQYPPYLDRFAVIGREVLGHVEGLGFPMPLIWRNLARTVAPKSLYAIGGMVEVLPDLEIAYDRAHPFRLAVIVHVSEVEGFAELLDRLDHFPSIFDLYVTTSDGHRAADLQRQIEKRNHPLIGLLDVRVTPASRGRDMSDFFVGCRDVLLGGRYDLVVKLHVRRMRRKTVNARRYFRRYQYENLLNSPGYVANVLALFQREPGLGFVFPPMMHIGYSTMGRGWADLEGAARRLSARLGIHVPQDRVSPLAPYGGMFIGRPEALRLLTDERWRYRDYSTLESERSPNLERVQERLIVSAGAELGYHSRTVLTSEHASISHAALETKSDYLFTSTRGWPVEQIQLLQRAGSMGHGGIVALSRMYIRLNHPRASRVLVPLYEMAMRGIVSFRLAKDGARRLRMIITGKPGGGEL